MATNFNMSSVTLNGDKYYDTNGNIIGDRSNGINNLSWQYLAKKYGANYADNVSNNLIKGNTYKNGKWFKDDSISANLNDYGASGTLVKKLGIDPESYFGTGLQMGAYFIPGLGTALSAYDTYKALKQGDYKHAAMYGAMMIPGLGGALGKAGQLALKTNKFTKTGKRLVKVVNNKKINKTTNIIGKTAGGAMLGETGIGLGKLAYYKLKSYYGSK